MKKRCVECHVDQRNMTAIHEDKHGVRTYVCKRCWKNLDYPEFVKEGSGNEPTQARAVEDLQPVQERAVVDEQGPKGARSDVPVE